MSERNFKHYVRNGMRGRWNHQHIESPTTNQGIPDTYYSIDQGGWIEFKFQIDWPKRPGTVLSLKNFKKEQKLWLRIHGRRTGRCFFFLKIGTDYLLYDCLNCQKIGSLEKRGMFRYALKTWNGRINFEELSLILNKDYRRNW